MNNLEIFKDLDNSIIEAKRLANFSKITLKKAKKSLFEPLENRISITPAYFTIFTDFSNIRKCKAAKNIKFGGSVQRVINTGTMSRAAASRMKRSIYYLEHASTTKKVKNYIKNTEFYYKLGFLTLTLSQKQKHSDNFIKKNLLKSFLDTLKSRYPALLYMWKAEAQNNGNIHFHLVIDHFIPLEYINKLWNKIQYKHGYLKKYLRINKTLKAPSTKIEVAGNTVQVARYIRKYLAKSNDKRTIKDIEKELNEKINELKNIKKDRQELKKHIKRLELALNEAKKRKIKGKLWGCSDILILPNYNTQINGIGSENFEYLNNFALIDTCSNEYMSIYKINDFKSFLKGFKGGLKDELINYYNKLIPPKRCPFKNFIVGENYSYKLT